MFILHTLLASGKYFPHSQVKNNAFDNLKSSHIYKHLPTKSSLEAAEWGVLVPGSIFNESLY